jgi:PAS domain S-box-containing protein
MAQPFARPDQGDPRAFIDLAVFRDAVETAPEAVFWMNAEGRLLYVNERACASLGYTQAELSSLSVWDIDPRLNRQTWADLWRQPATGLAIETSHRCKDGTFIPVEVSAKDLETAHGRLRIAFARDTTQRIAVMAALRRTQFAVDRARESIFWVKADGSFAYVNDAASQSLGYSRDELVRMSVFDIDADVTKEAWPMIWRRCRESGSVVSDRVHVSRSGRRFPVQIASTFMRFEGEEYSCTYARDMSDARRAEEEKAKLEAQLLHSQRLESVGRLAGGVAHDFNNMLSVIVGSAELAERRLQPGDPVLSQIQEIQKAAARARDVTRQLLAFSRKERISPKPVDLNELVERAGSALRLLIGEHIELRFEAGAGLAPILFDASQMDQILVNLVVNARDAVLHRGEIVLATTTARLEPVGGLGHVDAAPGDYVVLSVRDNGTGIDAATLPHIFEPFFTTKEVGKGTGLGLAMVYGLVRQHGGFIDVDSAPGRGTTFKLYIPAATRVSPASAPPPAEAAPGAGQGTILVVEDDVMVRTVTQAMLETLGYTVLVASSPLAALSVCERREVKIDLLITDVVMPDMTGPELRDRTREIRPELNVLFISGYASSALISTPDAPEVQVLPKPFSLSALAQATRNAMRC